RGNFQMLTDITSHIKRSYAEATAKSTIRVWKVWKVAPLLSAVILRSDPSASIELSERDIVAGRARLSSARRWAMPQNRALSHGRGALETARPIILRIASK